MIDKIDELLAKYHGETRAERVQEALRGLGETTAYAALVMCELSWEAKQKRYWLSLRKKDGAPYRNLEEFLREAWGCDLRISGLNHRVRIGWAITNWPLSSREWLRRQLTAIGWSRARLFITPLKRLCGDTEAIAKLIDRAGAIGSNEDVSRMLSVELLTQRPYLVKHGNLCPSCGRALRVRRPRVPRAHDPVAATAMLALVTA